MTDQIKGGKWVWFYCDSCVDLFYYDIVLVTEPWMLYWFLYHKHVCCAQMMCRMGVYIWGESKKFYVLTKRVKKNTSLFSLGIFQ